jgi:hypothetical protein
MTTGKIDRCRMQNAGLPVREYAQSGLVNIL